jgi:GT2 family glycosyltransferase
MISFIIINYNGLDDTINCIKSINSFFKINFEIILIDNSDSYDNYNTLLSIYKNFENIHIHKIKNNGFGNACNIGVNHSNGDILFFLNNDTDFIKAQNIHQLFDFVSNKNYIVTPKVLNPDKTIQKNIGGFFSILSCIIYFLQLGNKFKRNPVVNYFAKIIFKNNKTIQSYVKSNNNLFTDSIDWVSGCALIISKSNFFNIGGFDERFFMYFEDQDLCYSHKLNGQNCILFNDIILTHYIGGSQKNINFKMELIKFESLLYYSNKNIKNGKILKYIIFLISIPLFFFNKRINFLIKNYYFK